MDLGCEQALERLWPLTEPGGLDSPDLVAAREHLRHCRACQAFFRRDASLGSRLRDLKTAGSTPLSDACVQELRVHLAGVAKISGADAHVRPIQAGRRKDWRSYTEVFAAAAAIALLAGGLAISRSIQRPLEDGAFTKDFMHAELPEIESGNLTPVQVMAFYAEQFGDRMDPARLLDARVTRVAVCDIEGRRGAMVEYELGGERLVYYQIPLDGGRTTTDLRTGSQGGLNVARWGDARSEHVLVSSLPIEDLKAYAHEQRTN